MGSPLQGNVLSVPQSDSVLYSTLGADTKRIIGKNIDYDNIDLQGVTWEIGTIGTADGVNVSSTTRVRTVGFIAISKGWKINLTGIAIKYSIRVYGLDGVYRHTIYGTYTQIAEYVFAENVKIRLVIAYAGDTTVSDIPDLLQYLRIEKVDSIIPIEDQVIPFEMGTLSTVDGSLAASSTRLRTVDFIDVSQGWVVGLSDYTNSKFTILGYDSEEAYTGVISQFTTTDYKFHGDAKIKIVIAKSDDSTIDDQLSLINLVVCENTTPYMAINPSSYSWEIGTIDSTTGANVSSTKRIRTVGIIPITKGTKLSLKSTNIKYTLRFYDNTGTYLRALFLLYTQDDYVFDGDANVRLVISLSPEIDIVTIGATLVDFKIHKLPTQGIDVNNFWYGKKCVWTGDSISYGTGLTFIHDAYPYLVCNRLGMELTNYAIGGSTIAEKEGDIATKTPIIGRYSVMSDDADLIIVGAGTNDYQYEWTPLGTMTDRTNFTFYGAMHNLCIGLLDKYLGKTIAFITPIKRSQSPYLLPTDVNANGKTLKDYCEIIKEVCDYYSIPVLDMYSVSGINPAISSHATYYFSDESVLTHPNTNGHVVMGDVTTAFLKNLKAV